MMKDRRDWDVTGLCSESNRFEKDFIPVDITDKVNIQALVRSIKPDAIVHLAAVTSAAICHDEHDYARAVNLQGSIYLAEAARENGSRLIFASTDLVFDGDNPPYKEDDLPRPVCDYGLLKAMAEESVQFICLDYCIVRIALVYGISVNSARTFFQEMIDSLGEDRKIGLFIDEHRTPIHVENVAQALIEIINRPEINGIVHLAGRDRLARYELGAAACERMNFSKELLIPIKIEDKVTQYTRPKDVSLESRRQDIHLVTPIWDICKGLDRVHGQYKKITP